MKLLGFLGGRRNRSRSRGRRKGKKNAATGNVETKEGPTILPEPGNEKNPMHIATNERHQDFTNSTEGESGHVDDSNEGLTVQETMYEDEKKEEVQQKKPDLGVAEEKAKNDASSLDLEDLEDPSFEIVDSPENKRPSDITTIVESPDKSNDETEILQKFKAKSPARMTVAERAAWLEKSAFKEDNNSSSYGQKQHQTTGDELSPESRGNTKQKKMFWQGKAFHKETSNAPDPPSLRNKTGVLAKKTWLETVAFTPSGGGNMTEEIADATPEKRKHTINLLPSSPVISFVDGDEPANTTRAKELLKTLSLFEQQRLQTNVYLNKESDDLAWAYEAWFRKGLLPWRCSTFADGPDDIVYDSLREKQTSPPTSPTSSKDHSPMRSLYDSPQSTSSAIRALRDVSPQTFSEDNDMPVEGSEETSDSMQLDNLVADVSDSETDIITNIVPTPPTEPPLKLSTSGDHGAEAANSNDLILNKSGDEHEWVYSRWSQEGLLNWRPAQTESEIATAPTSVKDLPAAVSVPNSIDEASTKGVVNLSTKSSFQEMKERFEADSSMPTDGIQSAHKNSNSSNPNRAFGRDVADFNPFGQSQSTDSLGDQNLSRPWEQNGSVEWTTSEGSGAAKDDLLSKRDVASVGVSSATKSPATEDASDDPENSETITGTDTTSTMETLETSEPIQQPDLVAIPESAPKVDLNEQAEDTKTDGAPLEGMPSQDLSDGVDNVGAPALPVDPASNIVSSDCSVQSADSDESDPVVTIPSGARSEKGEDFWKMSSLTLSLESKRSSDISKGLAEDSGKMQVIMQRQQEILAKLREEDEYKAAASPEASRSSEAEPQGVQKISLFERQQEILAKMRDTEEEISTSKEATESLKSSGSNESEPDADGDDLDIYLLQQSILEKMQHEAVETARSHECDASPSETTAAADNVGSPSDANDVDKETETTDSSKKFREHAKQYLGSEYTSDSYELISTDGESGVQLEPSVVTHASSITVEDISELNFEHVFEDMTPDTSRDVAASFELMDEMQFQTEMKTSSRSREQLSPDRASQSNRADIDGMIALLEDECRAVLDASKKDHAPAQPSRQVSTERNEFGQTKERALADLAPAQPSRKASVEGLGIGPIGTRQDEKTDTAQNDATPTTAMDHAPAQPTRKVSVEGVELVPSQKWIDSIKLDCAPISPVRVASTENMRVYRTPDSLRKARAKKIATVQRAKYVMWLTHSRAANFNKSAKAPNLTWFANKSSEEKSQVQKDDIAFLMPFVSVPPWKTPKFRGQRTARKKAPTLKVLTLDKRTLPRVVESVEDAREPDDKAVSFDNLIKGRRDFFSPSRRKAESEALARFESAQKLKLNHMRRGFGKAPSQKRIVCL